MTYTLIKI